MDGLVSDAAAELVVGLVGSLAYVGRESVDLAEHLGYDSIWAGEHVVAPHHRVLPSPMEPTDPILDPLIHLAVVATAATERVLLATGPSSWPPQRNRWSWPSRSPASTSSAAAASCWGSERATWSPC